MPKLNTIEENAKRLIGVEFNTINYGKCVVVDYKGCTNVLVKFYEPECYTTCQYSSLVKGRVANPNFPTVYWKGYTGVGKYNGSKDRKVYKLWETMLKRAYCPKYRKDTPSYNGVTVCKEWLNFQNFADWCYSQNFFGAKDIKGNSYQLDKDLLIKGNKIYSPQHCCFVPNEINVLLINNKRDRGSCPVGVSVNKNKYLATLSRVTGKLYLGRFKSKEEAFLVYKEAKEKHIRETAEKWRGMVDDKVYEAMLRWEIHIDD